MILMPYNKIQFTTGLFYNVHSNNFCTGKLLQICLIVKVSLNDSTDYERPIKPFSVKFRTFGIGQTNWAFGVFSSKLSASVLVQ